MEKNEYIDSLNQFYKVSYNTNIDLQILGSNKIINLKNSAYPNLYSFYRCQLTIIKPDNAVVNIPQSDSTGSGDGNIILKEVGQYLIRYSGTIRNTNLLTGQTNDKSYSFTYTISAIENKLPLKKWTITDVINRLCDVAEPIRRGEKPRFKLNPEQAAKFDKILSPQFSFTRQTLRECLQEVGKVVHGEPRLTPKKDENGKYYFEITYDMFASSSKSGIYTRKYVSETVSQVVDRFTTWLDSSAENLVNALDKFSGVITEPYSEGAKTVRTENLYVRVEEGNMLIPTQYPIYSVDKLEYVYSDGGELKSVNITPWLFERSIYDTQLSSYDQQYPYSKAYGLYFTQGEKNIGGLNFKVDAAVAAVFKNYAIVNILRQATGNTGLTIDSYPIMAFRVTYTPFYSVRVAQTKVNYKDFKRPAALVYNQAANVIESRYYGENLKGAIARLGNVDMTKTYRLYRLFQIPKAGQLYNDEYYISAVYVEYLPTCILCTIALSKDFNRLSAYIGVNSEKRYWEISQNQAVERNTLWREYIVVGKKESPDSDAYTGQNLLATIARTFTQEGGQTPITNVAAWGTTAKGADIQGDSAINLPVISSAFGNSISFSWRYEDNYSAGASVHYENVENGPQGYFQNNQPYCDYYGRIYYYNFDLQVAGETPTADTVTDIGIKLPLGVKPSQSSGYVSTIGKEPITLRKDNREILQCNFQVDFVSNNNIIIGSALASYCPAVRGTDKTLAAKLYVLPMPINKFMDHIEGWEDVDLNALPSADISVEVADGYFIVNAANFPANGKSWVIATAQTNKPSELVEDEQGNQFEQSEVYGGDLLIGQNIEVMADQAFTPIYFTVKREIFDKTVWKDKR